MDIIRMNGTDWFIEPRLLRHRFLNRQTAIPARDHLQAMEKVHSLTVRGREVIDRQKRR